MRPSGVSVGVSGQTIVVGASAHASGSGRAYVFEGNLGTPLSPAAASTATAGGSKLPDPDIAAFIPANYRVTSVQRMDLDGNGLNEEAITAVGLPAPLGYVPTTVVLIAWDTFANDGRKCSTQHSKPRTRPVPKRAKGDRASSLLRAHRLR